MSCYCVSTLAIAVSTLYILAASLLHRLDCNPNQALNFYISLR